MQSRVADDIEFQPLEGAETVDVTVNATFLAKYKKYKRDADKVSRKQEFTDLMDQLALH